MFPTRKNSQKWVKIQKSNQYLSDIYFSCNLQNFRISTYFLINMIQVFNELLYFLQDAVVTLVTKSDRMKLQVQHDPLPSGFRVCVNCLQLFYRPMIFKIYPKILHDITADRSLPENIKNIPDYVYTFRHCLFKKYFFVSLKRFLEIS